MNLFTVSLEKAGKKPLYEQLYSYVVEEILNGNLKKGEKLPSKKLLASHLQISVITVENAYNLLMQEGYIFSRPRSGYYIGDIESTVRICGPSEVKKQHSPEPEYKFDFRTNAVDISSFPYATWAKLSKETIYNNPGLLVKCDARGDDGLRKALAKYLHEFRGVNCDSRQIIVGAGIEYLLMLLDEMLDKKSIIAVENPCYPKTCKIFRNAGRNVRAIDIDENGISVNELEKSGADLVYITPSHQFPTGCTMPAGRRIKLLKWAAGKNSRYIIEDDYNSEFNFSGRPIPSLQGLDKYEKVIYIGTFSRILAPSFRIAYMVVPYHLLKITQEMFGTYSSTVSRFEQNTLKEFIERGFLSRHINRVKNIYKRRRELILSELSSLAEIKGFEFYEKNAGSHSLIEVSGILASDFINKSKSRGVRFYAADYYYINGCTDNKFLIGYGNMSDREIISAFDQLRNLDF